ncbi:MAG: site-specific DNA-methyltransferase [Phycisphaeraceae bacterium]|nr:MAG: site-specific DNA-methyltransferase [Phycisphaeraceae bacterium]
MSGPRKKVAKKGTPGAMAPAVAAAPATATRHILNLGDARDLGWVEDGSVHLALTSPPYFNLKKYNDHPDQLGDLDDYEAFLDQLDTVWEHCFRALVPGGRLICVVGDVCIARRRNKGRHHVVPLHADISVRCRRLGFDYLTPILWHKIANASFEVENGSAGFLGKPYEPNAIIKNDIEYILMLRKPGGYRKPTEAQRNASRISKADHPKWFRSFWTDVTGASTREHPAPYPIELASRLVQMFSFTGDVVLDPFAGTGTTSVAAIRHDRSSVSNEIDPDYFKLLRSRIDSEAKQSILGRPAPEVVVATSSAGVKKGRGNQRSGRSVVIDLNAAQCATSDAARPRNVRSSAGS